MGQILGVDISENNDLCLEDFQAMVNAGVEFVVIRSSYGLHSADSRFKEYCGYADQVGLRKQAYHYSYGHNAEEVAQEAENCRKVIEDAGVSLEMVWYDCEEARLRGWATEACKAFLDNVGLHCGVYASLSWFPDEIDYESLGCSIWVAQYNRTCDLKGYMWQFTDAFEINGKAFDGDYIFIED